MKRQHALDFLHEAILVNGVWCEPSDAVIAARRDALNLVVRAARRLGIVPEDFNPTADLMVGAHQKIARRPLTDDEVIRGRLAANGSGNHTRRAAAWALGEASGTSGEIQAAELQDLDLQAGVVWLRGHTGRQPRWGTLTSWGIDALAERVEKLDGRRTTPLVAPAAEGRDEDNRAGHAVGEVLRLARLSRDPTVSPMSLANWAGRRAFDASGQIADAARVLGIRSLDKAARAISWSWR